MPLVVLLLRHSDACAAVRKSGARVCILGTAPDSDVVVPENEDALLYLSQILFALCAQLVAIKKSLN